ncbi:MAG: hypothetical protein PHU85_00070 [Phycisphaerae bacterium]|nr:hypothetical protein [Phycisphaerae bacterium]
MAVDASGLKIHPIPGDPDNVIIESGGMREGLALPAAHRAHRVGSLDDFLRACERWGEHGTVWHSEANVTLLIDDEYRRDGVFFPLQFSEQFERLRKLRAEQRLNQVGIIRLLRHDLVGAVPGDLVPLFRKLDFKRRSDGTTNIQHGRESLGRSVEAEVSGTADLPELITADIRVYRSVGIIWKKSVRMTLDVDPANEVFYLCPEPDALEAAIQSTQDDIANTLSAGLVDDPPRIFYGEP